MPYRKDLREVFWWVPGGLQGAEEPDYPSSPPTVAEILDRPGHESDPPVRKLDITTLVGRAPINPDWPPRGVILAMRDRMGFRYERVVGLDDFISQSDAAELIGVPTMTVNRWITRQRLLKSRKKNGFSVVKVRDVLTVARERGLSVPQGRRLMSDRV